MEILGDMMSVVNSTRYGLVQELDKNKERRTGYNFRNQIILEEERGLCSRGGLCTLYPT
jgi:hypothetical protein